MGNPFKSVKSAIKNAYHSGSSSATPQTGPDRKPTVVKARHAVPPPHSEVAERTTYKLSGKTTKDPPPSLPARVDGSSVEPSGTAEATAAVDEVPVAGPSHELPPTAAKPGTPGPELPPRQKSDVKVQTLSDASGKESAPEGANPAASTRTKAPTDEFSTVASQGPPKTLTTEQSSSTTSTTAPQLSEKQKGKQQERLETATPVTSGRTANEVTAGKPLPETPAQAHVPTEPAVSQESGNSAGTDSPASEDRNIPTVSKAVTESPAESSAQVPVAAKQSVQAGTQPVSLPQLVAFEGVSTEPTKPRNEGNTAGNPKNASFLRLTESPSPESKGNESLQKASSKPQHVERQGEDRTGPAQTKPETSVQSVMPVPAAAEPTTDVAKGVRAKAPVEANFEKDAHVEAVDEQEVSPSKTPESDKLPSAQTVETAAAIAKATPEDPEDVKDKAASGPVSLPDRTTEASTPHDQAPTVQGATEATAVTATASAVPSPPETEAAQKQAVALPAVEPVSPEAAAQTPLTSSAEVEDTAPASQPISGRAILAESVPDHSIQKEKDSASTAAKALPEQVAEDSKGDSAKAGAAPAQEQAESSAPEARSASSTTIPSQSLSNAKSGEPAPTATEGTTPDDTMVTADNASDKTSSAVTAQVSFEDADRPNPGQPIDLHSPTVLDHLKRIYEDIVPVTVSNSVEEAKKKEYQEAAKYFLNFVQKEAEIQSRGFTLETLEDFLQHMATSANAVAPLGDQDMSLPLPNYFVNSSHNTYLTGNQLYSESSVNVYRDVLERGCRCLEIDVWDGDASSIDQPGSSDSDSSSDSDEEEKGTVKGMLHEVHSAESHIRSGLKRNFKSEAKSMMSSLSGGMRRVSSKAKQHVSEESPDGGTLTQESTLSEEKPNSLDEETAKSTRIEPRVLHGHTLTRDVPFREVCEVIRDSSFRTSDLPVIVSLEIHTCHEQQKVMVEIMEEVWKDSLVKVPPELRQKLIEGKVESLPSPAELRGKILIKVKSAPHSAKGDTPPQDSSGMEGEVLKPVTTTPSTSSEEASRAGGSEKPEKAEKKAKIIEELSALGIYTSAFSFKGFDAPESRLANHIFSLSEPKLLDYFKRDRVTLFEHNRNYMMRSYPSQTRVTSSNPDPSFSWRQGVQFAALNWQNTDLGMMLNRAMFEDSGGWVVKPEPYRCDAWRNSLKKPLEDPRRTISLMVDVYAGQDIPLRTYTNPKKFHPYVTCQLHVEKPGEGVKAYPSASSEKLYYETWKRKTEASTGANPDFDGQRLQFARCSGVMEKLTFVRFKVKDHELMRDALCGWACIRLDRLRSGFRFIRLFDREGRATNGVLLVRISKQVC